jgi:hypothetical protein
MTDRMSAGGMTGAPSRKKFQVPSNERRSGPCAFAID